MVVVVGCDKLAGSRFPQSTTITASAGTPECVRHNIVYPGARTAATNGGGISLTCYDSCHELHVFWCAGARLLSHHADNVLSGELVTPYRYYSYSRILGLTQTTCYQASCHTLPLRTYSGVPALALRVITQTTCYQASLSHPTATATARILVCRRSPCESSRRQRVIRRACHTLPLLQLQHVFWCAGARLASHHADNVLSGELVTPYRYRYCTYSGVPALALRVITQATCYQASLSHPTAFTLAPDQTWRDDLQQRASCDGVDRRRATGSIFRLRSFHPGQQKLIWPLDQTLGTVTRMTHGFAASMY